MRVTAVRPTAGRAIAALAYLVAGGCAAAGTEPADRGTAPPAMVSAGAEAEPPIALAEHREVLALSADVEQLSSALQCDAACDAGARLCALAERLCEIAERHPLDGEVANRCADGRARCERARARLDEACACPNAAP